MGNRKKKVVNHANRGRALEILVNYELDRLRFEEIGIITKQHVHWNVIRRGKQIVKAFPVEKSTVDYMGLYKGKPVAFDAKSTRDETSFPLGNIKPHQIEFLKVWEKVGGIGFWLVEFANLTRWFVLQQRELLHFLSTETRKSIPLSYFEEHAAEIKPSGSGFLPFLSVFDEGEG